MRRERATAGWLRPLAVALVAALLILATRLPIWTSRLVAPQYPKGLWVVAYGDRIDGDVTEINELNHYIGMRTIDLDIAPEVGLWTLGIAAVFALAVAGLFLAGWPRRVAVALLWAVPIAVIADIQRHLYAFGHSLDPAAALRVAPFTPLAIGPTTVWNFRIWAFPGPALLLLAAVAAVVTAATIVPGRPRHPKALAAAALFVAMITSAGRAAPASASSAASSFDLAAAIDTTPAGAELLVPGGTYRGPLLLRRSISLIANGHVVIDGGGHGSVITVAAADVIVRGVHVMGSGGQLDQAAGIFVTADRVSIEHVLVTDSYNGVLVRGAHGVRIEDVRVVGRGGRSSPAALDTSHHPAAGGDTGDGISLWSASGLLLRSSAVERARDGIYLSYVDDALIDSNTVSGSRYAVHAMYGSGLMVFGNRISGNASGLVLMYTRDAEAARNTIIGQRGATGYGVLLKDTPHVRLVENVIARNVVGIRAEGLERTADSEALRNDVAYNTVGVDLAPTAALTFTRNSFDENLVNVRSPTTGTATWTKTGAGNYWSDYRGLDVSGDGIGDVPHVEGTSADRLLDRVPALEAFRMSLAMHVLREAERWWDVSGRARVEDAWPLIEPQTQPLPAPARNGADLLGWTILGGAMLGAAGVALVLGRRAP